MPQKPNAMYIEALIKILFEIIERTPAGGASRQELMDTYQEMTGERPNERTIRRIVDRINASFASKASIAWRNKKTAATAVTDDDEYDDPMWTQGEKTGAIQAVTDGGIRKYRFTKSLDPGSDLKPEVLSSLALQLYPQKAQMGPEAFASIFALLMKGLPNQELMRYLHVSGFSPTQIRDNLRRLLQILDAIKRRKRLRFDYQSVSTGEHPKERDVESFGLICRHSCWYMVGYCHTARARRIFRIDHMNRLSPKESTCYEIPADFSLEKAYGSAWGIWTESSSSKQTETVLLKVDAEIAGHFRATCYHSSQRIEENDVGVMVRFQVTGAKEMIPWLMGWGLHVQVMEPAWLRDEIIAAASGIINRYQEEEHKIS